MGYRDLVTVISVYKENDKKYHLTIKKDEKL